MLGISFDKSLIPLNELVLPFVLRGFILKTKNAW
jgi:hypothetical protein